MRRWGPALLAAGALAVACGGRATGPGGDSSSSGSSSGASSSSGSSGGAPPDAGASTDAGTCVSIDPSAYDASCTADSDCALILTGLVCSGQCGCFGNTPINVAGVARFQAAIAGIAFEDCPCVAPPPVRCVASRCTECDFGSQAPGCKDGG